MQLHLHTYTPTHFHPFKLSPSPGSGRITAGGRQGPPVPGATPTEMLRDAASRGTNSLDSSSDSPYPTFTVKSIACLLRLRRFRCSDTGRSRQVPGGSPVKLRHCRATVRVRMPAEKTITPGRFGFRAAGRDPTRHRACGLRVWSMFAPANRLSYRVCAVRTVSRPYAVPISSALWPLAR
jgi:hypothetical protein